MLGEKTLFFILNENFGKTIEVTEKMEEYFFVEN